MVTVAVCEDDPALRSVLRRALTSQGYDVRMAVTGAELITLAERAAPDAVVLDLGLPDADGRDVCLALRGHGVDAPVLMLTALDGVHNKVAGFQSGADDYLTKPFDLPELLARVEVLLRRATTSRDLTDGLQLDPVGHRLVRGEAVVSLSPTEFRLLSRMMSAGVGEVVRRRSLVAAGWPHGGYVSENTLDSYVRRVRAKLAELGATTGIRTVRGVGYRWE